MKEGRNNRKKGRKHTYKEIEGKGERRSRINKGDTRMNDEQKKGRKEGRKEGRKDKK